MVALDTNVIVRYIAQDDPLQSKAATRIFEEVISDENHGFITSIAMCETIWVLARAYGQPREKLAQVIEALLKAGNLELEHRDLVWSAREDFLRGKADFCNQEGRRNARSASTSPASCLFPSCVDARGSGSARHGRRRKTASSPSW